MTGVQTVWLMVVFFLTSAVSAVTGSTSLVMVPAMLQFHLEPRMALATNMCALTFMSAGSTVPFLWSPLVNRARSDLSSIVTICWKACSETEHLEVGLIPHDQPIGHLV